MDQTEFEICDEFEGNRHNRLLDKMGAVHLDHESCKMSDIKTEATCKKIEAQVRLFDASMSGVVYGAFFVASFCFMARSGFLLSNVERGQEQLSEVSEPDMRLEICKNVLTPVFERQCSGIDKNCQYCDPKVSEQTCLSDRFAGISSLRQCEQHLESRGNRLDFLNKLAFALLGISGGLTGGGIQSILRHRKEVKKQEEQIKKTEEFFDKRIAERRANTSPSPS